MSTQCIPIHHRFAVVAVCVLTAAAGCGEPKIGEICTQVHKDYRTAVENRDGATATGLLADVSIEHFDQLRNAALSMDEEELRKQEPSYQLFVLKLRRDVDAATLQSLDGRGLFAHIVDAGWQEAGAEAMQIGDVQRQGDDRAFAQVYADGAPTRERAYFVLEESGWKLNILPNFSGSDRRLSDTAAESGIPIDEYILSQLQLTSEEPIAEMIWQPLEATNN